MRKFRVCVRWNVCMRGWTGCVLTCVRVCMNLRAYVDDIRIWSESEDRKTPFSRRCASCADTMWMPDAQMQTTKWQSVLALSTSIRAGSALQLVCTCQVYFTSPRIPNMRLFAVPCTGSLNSVFLFTYFTMQSLRINPPVWLKSFDFLQHISWTHSFVAVRLNFTTGSAILGDARDALWLSHMGAPESKWSRNKHTFPTLPVRTLAQPYLFALRRSFSLLFV